MSDIVVLKFGGVALRDAEGVKTLCRIIGAYPEIPLIVVASAMAKTTNALEKVVDSYFSRDGRSMMLLEDIYGFHFGVTEKLFPKGTHPVFDHLRGLCGALTAYVQSEPGGNYDFEYDQIVSYGELFSTAIVSHYLKEKGLENTLFDARGLIVTDDHHREGRVRWEKTGKQVHAAFDGFFSGALFRPLAVTQGFIARSEGGDTTTLAREGSDFSAAIFGFVMDAAEVVIWKDVPGLLNANPGLFPDARLIPEISYAETIELSWYGASVIHPNTVKPLQNKKIPLRIKSFMHPAEPGTLISSETENAEIIPSFIFRDDQMLISISTADYSYIGEQHLHQLFGIFSDHGIRINMMQNSAISFSVCIDNPGRKTEALMTAMRRDFRLRYNEKLRLVTIRNYSQEIIEKVVGHARVLLEQKSRHTFQAVTD